MRRDRLAALGDLLGVAARRHGEGRIAVEPAVAFVGTLGKAAVRGDEGRAGPEARPDPGCGADTLVAPEEMEGEEAGRADDGAGGGGGDIALCNVGTAGLPPDQRGAGVYHGSCGEEARGEREA